MKLFLITVFTIISTLSATEKLWNCEGFLQPESVVHYEKEDLYFISNVEGIPNEKDGKGFISIIQDGEIKKLRWVEGLNAPKGMGIYNNRLYVADIDELVIIDIEKASIIKRHKAKGAVFLNDVAVTSSGEVFISDMLTNTIYQYRKNRVKLWLEDNKLSSPNGLYFDNGLLYVASWGVMTGNGFETTSLGDILRISPKDKSITPYGVKREIGNLDGLEKMDENSFIVSDYMAGKIFKITPNSVKELMTLPHGSADIHYNPGTKVLIVPQMAEGVVTAYQL